MNGFSLAATASGVVGGLAATGYLIATKDRREWQTIWATVALVLGFEMALVGIFGWPISKQDSSSSPSPSTSSTTMSISPSSTTITIPVPTTTTQPPLALITKPTPGAKVDRCIQALIKSNAPSGYTYRVGAAPVSEQDSNYYFPRDVEKFGAEWAAWPVYLGEDGGYNLEFDIILYQIPNSVIGNYSSPKARDHAYTLDELKNAGIKILEKVRVKRTSASDANADSCAQKPVVR